MARGKFQARRGNGIYYVIILILLVLIAITGAYILRTLNTQGGDTQPNLTTDTTPTKNPSTTLPTEPSTEPTTEPTTVPTEPYVVSTASVGVTGDILIHSPVYNAMLKNNVYDFSSIFTYIGEYYEKYDFMVANLEVPLAGASKGYSGYPQFNCPDSIVDALKDAGVDMVLNANNHTYDQGHSGFVRTQEVLNEKGMLHLGTRLSTDTPLYIVQEINGIKVGMVCYTYETGDTSDGRKTLNGISVSHDDTDLIGSFHPKKLDEFYTEVQTVLEAMYQDGAEATMLYIHWGDEYHTTQNSQQTEIAQQLCELGIDVIVGGHPHVIQPFATLTSTTGHTTYCIYSVGNAISNQRRTNISSAPNGHTEDSMIFGVTFEKWNDGSVKIRELDILPIWVCKEWTEKKGNSYYILPLDLESDWERFDIISGKYLDGSYKRTMEIVGEGLNAAREALGLAPRPMTAE